MTPLPHGPWFVLDWKAISALAMLLALFGGAMWWALRWLIIRQVGQFDERLGHLADKGDGRSKEIRRIERDLNELEKRLPLEYVQRDDWIRFSGMIDAKLEKLHDAITTLGRETK